jgi:hypothetical protein
MKSIRLLARIIRTAGINLIKGAVVALVSIIGMVVGGLIASLIGLPTPVVPSYVNTATMFPLLFISGIAIAIVLGECFQKLPFSYWQRVTTLVICIYILYYLANILDAYLYSPLPNMSTSIFSDLFPALFMSLVIASLWRPKSGTPTKSWTGLLNKGRTLDGFAWRFMFAWLCYPPIYYLVGLLVVPFTKSYYEDPSHSLGLVLSPLWAILLMQLPRGALFLLSILPILLNWPGSRRITLWFWIGMVIFIQIASPVLFQAYWLPAEVRIPHAIELFTDSFIQTGLYVLLFVPVGKMMMDSARTSRVQAEDPQFAHLGN